MKCRTASLTPARDFKSIAVRAMISLAAVGALSFSTAELSLSEDIRPLSFDHDQSLVDSDFSDHKLDLRGAIFSKANCTRANFKGVDIQNALIDDANFTEACLDDVNATNVLASNAKFYKASLRGVNFTK